MMDAQAVSSTMIELWEDLRLTVGIVTGAVEKAISAGADIEATLGAMSRCDVSANSKRAREVAVKIFLVTL